jgi:hypothetical protein
MKGLVKTLFNVEAFMEFSSFALLLAMIRPQHLSKISDYRVKVTKLRSALICSILAVKSNVIFSWRITYNFIVRIVDLDRFKGSRSVGMV